MKLKMFILVFLLCANYMYAQENVSELTQKNAEILLLQEKVKALEKELKQYKQVKPGASNFLLPDKKIYRKTKNQQNNKYELSALAPEKVSAYFTATYQTVYELTSKLKKNGFEVLSTDEIYKDYIVITVTNDELKSTNSFISTLHLSVNISSKTIMLQNPDYFAAAYLQDKYKYGIFHETMTSLVEVLGNMYSMRSKKSLEDLETYNFMLGMPTFNDIINLANSEDILQKLDSNESLKHISYKLELPNGSVLVGHKLKASTYEFFEKINVKEYAGMFPYEVMIEDTHAYMMHPKYYLALALPLMSMTDFMKIASAPVEIIKDIQASYK